MSKKLSARDLLIRGLEACGWTRDPSAKTKKFQVYKSAIDERRAYVGRSGALRLAKDGSVPVAKTISHTGGVVHRAYMAVGAPNVTFTSTEEARAAFVLAIDTLRQRGQI